MPIRKIFALILLTLSSTSYAYQTDDILGYWLTEEEDAVVEVYKTKDEFRGRLVWLRDLHTGKEKVLTDKENPDKKLRSRSLKGMDIMWGYEFNGEKWVDGKVYDPLNGKTYSGKMWLESKDVLGMRGYIGISLFGRSSEWKRQASALPKKYSH